MAECPGPSGEFLLLVATAVSLQLAAGRSAAELEVFAAFFTLLGDNLAMIALRRSQEAGSTPEQGLTGLLATEPF